MTYLGSSPRQFHNEGRFDDAQVISNAQSHTRSIVHALRAAGFFGRIGTAEVVESCRTLLRDIQEEPDTVVASGHSVRL